ncbi:MAG: hypothetical protein AAF267_12965 [Deinococcota bacterium]
MKNNLVVPVYLNQRLVFDLLAMLQGGISTVTSVTQTEGANNTSTEKIKAGFGLSEAFSSLLKIDLSGERDKLKENTSERKSSEERVHTPASLFFQLREMMIERQFLTELTAENCITPGNFVEFEASLSKNPLVESLDSIIELLSLAKAFESPAQSKTNKSKKSGQNQNLEIVTMQKQLESLNAGLKAGNTVDVTTNGIFSRTRAVITLETSFLNDPMMSDLVDGRFKVIGKVIQNVDESGSINLLRKTALSKAPKDILTQLLTAFSTLGDGGFDLPDTEPEIKGPALHILPIAIYA